jgi:O-antigen/teichoic acid export membrane protein
MVTRAALITASSQLVVFASAAIGIPLALRALGPERFGGIALIWVLLTYFALLDFGMAKSTTRFVSVSLSKGARDEVARIVWNAIFVQIAIGLAAGALAWYALPQLTHFEHVGAGDGRELEVALRAMAFVIPFTLVIGIERAALEAGYGFGWVALVVTPMNALSYVVPALAGALGLGMLQIVSTFIGIRIVAVIALALMLRRRYGVTPSRLDRSVMAQILRFGGWIAVSSVIGPVLLYLDRVVVGVVFGLSVLAYYSPSFDAATRLWFVSGSVALALFPRFSAGHAVAESFDRAVRYVLMLVGPVAIFLFFEAADVIALWLGPSAVAIGVPTMRVVAVGVIASALGAVPLALLQSSGRAGYVAAFHIAQAAPYVILLVALTGALGPVGAAIAWSVRLVVDSTYLFARARPLLPHVEGMTMQRLAYGLSAIVVLTVLDAILVWLGPTALVRLGALALANSTFVLATYRFLFEEHERIAFRVAVAGSRRR